MVDIRKGIWPHTTCQRSSLWISGTSGSYTFTLHVCACMCLALLFKGT